MIITIYTIFGLAISGVGDLSATKDGGKTAVVDVFHQRGYTWAATVIIIMAMIGMFAVIFLGVIGLTRYTYNLAKDGLYFKAFKEIDEKKKVPVKGAWYNIIPCILISTFFEIKVLAQTTSIIFLLTYIIVNASLIELRFRHKLERSNRYKIAIVLYCIISFVICMSIYLAWPLAVTLIFVAIAVLLFIYVQYEICKAGPPPREANTYKVPCVPLLPFIGIFTNAVLCIIGTSPI